ncbi:hypothetical protein [Chromohalobacter sp. HP20-39]|uniref:hypothetical protein n=1 Tax=Chromohalobacter sp. HP20-39 TaxID=3079306 RepID=UPI00294AF2E2|nr:hypothetical protein [Chromohalobacter sp. HP20-39]MDV6318678.1 hypothetical protein [Chromohalobacter sp. HP20-39]
MNTQLKPWAKGPFELILHAEIHYRRGEDYDRRLALISFDNSIEVSITAYLSLNPIQRGAREYARQDVETWKRNFHSKLDFFESEIDRRGLTPKIGKDLMVWYHDHRNEQYHGGSRGVPEQETLDGIREAALWVFSVLFEITDVGPLLDEGFRQRNPGLHRQREDAKDRIIDDSHGLVELAGGRYYTSELLFAVDPDLYNEMGNELIESEEVKKDHGEEGEQ